VDTPFVMFKPYSAIAALELINAVIAPVSVNNCFIDSPNLIFFQAITIKKTYK
jgi:hypothetical protein